MKKFLMAFFLTSIALFAHSAWNCKEDGSLLTWAGVTDVRNGKLLYKMECMSGHVFWLESPN